MSIIYNHMLDMAFSVETTEDDEAIFDEKNMPILLARARARLDDIEREGNIEAFGLCDTYEVNND